MPDRLRATFPEVSPLSDNAEDDMVAFMAFPRGYGTLIHSTQTLERLNAHIKRRTHVLGINSNDGDVVQPVGATPPKMIDPWSLIRRDMPLEGLQAL